VRADRDYGNRPAEKFRSNFSGQLAHNSPRADDFRHDFSRQGQTIQNFFRPFTGSHVHKLRGARQTVFAENLAAQKVAEQISDKNQVRGFGQGNRIFKAHRKQLIETVKLQELQAGAFINFAFADEFECFLRYSIGLAVAIVIGIFNQLTITWAPAAFAALLIPALISDNSFMKSHRSEPFSLMGPFPKR
jgi:hypothetical protein